MEVDEHGNTNRYDKVGDLVDEDESEEGIDWDVD